MNWKGTYLTVIHFYRSDKSKQNVIEKTVNFQYLIRIKKANRIQFIHLVKLLNIYSAIKVVIKHRDELLMQASNFQINFTAADLYGILITPALFIATNTFKRVSGILWAHYHIWVILHLNNSRQRSATINK